MIKIKGTVDGWAMQCDLCESWEHVRCLRGSDKLDDVLYDALSNSRSKELRNYVRE